MKVAIGTGNPAKIAAVELLLVVSGLVVSSFLFLFLLVFLICLLVMMRLLGVLRTGLRRL